MCGGFIYINYGRFKFTEEQQFLREKKKKKKKERKYKEKAGYEHMT